MTGVLRFCARSLSAFPGLPGALIERIDRARSPVHAACEAHEPARLQELLQLAPTQVMQHQPEAESPQLTTVLRPLHDPDLRDNDGHTALSVASLSGAFDCIPPLLSAQAQVSLARKPPVLHASIQSLSLPVAQEESALCHAISLLIDHGAENTEQDDDWMTPLHHAAGLLHNFGSSVLTTLLDRGAADAVDCQDRNGRTALHVAAFNGNDAHVHTLRRSAGASLMIADAGGRTPLHAAAREGAIACCNAILDAETAVRNELLQAQDRHHRTPFDVAQAAGHSQALLQLLQSSQSAYDGDMDISYSPLPDTSTPSSATSPSLIVAPPECMHHHTCPPPPGPNAPPENIRRLRCLVDDTRGALRAREFRDGIDSVGRHSMRWREHVGGRRLAALGDILRVHDWPYAKKVQTLCQSGFRNLDGDTHISSRSYEAALAGAQAVMGAIEEICNGRARNAFCAIRPPGHHAGPRGVSGCNSHGFCLLSNAALAAAHARSMQRHSGVHRVAIVDFDVHHGNGTQACLEATQPEVLHHKVKPMDGFVGEFAMDSAKPILDPDEDRRDLLFASVHGFDGAFYPGTGETTAGLVPPNEREDWSKDGVMLQSPENEDDIGAECGDKPRLVNVGMYGRGPKQDRAKHWRRVWKGLVLPEIYRFNPDLIVISAGFDAHMRDTLQGPVNLGVRESDYEWLTEEIVKIAESCSNGRVLSALEGGYKVQGDALSHFARSVQSHVRALQRPAREVFDPDILKGEVLEEWEERRQIEEEEERKRQEHLLQMQREEEERMRQLREQQQQEQHDGEQAAASDMPDGDSEKQRNEDDSDRIKMEDEFSGKDCDAKKPEDDACGENEERLSKRMRTKEPVDWKALDAQLDREQQQQQPPYQEDDIR